MENAASTDPVFLAMLESWLRDQPEILVMLRHPYAAGAKDFERFFSIEALSERLSKLTARTSIIAFKSPQLPLRGVVDDGFIERCQQQIDDGAEFLVLEMEPTTRGSFTSFDYSAGESHAELREELALLRGRRVAVGLYPPWLKDNLEVVSAIVPDQDGVARTAAY